MTVRVIGPDGETPFTLGAVGISFSWDSSDPSVAVIAPIYKEGAFLHHAVDLNWLIVAVQLEFH